MAQRPSFFVNYQKGCCVKEEIIEFEWHPGLSITQKIKSINSLHCAIKKKFPDVNVLEISSKSDVPLGKELSAFNLYFKPTGFSKSISLEVIFQSSKVFDLGGPYTDILNKTSVEAKHDERLKKSGNLKFFYYSGYKWPLEPKTLFYDWLYLQALIDNKNLANSILNYDCFTDIEFNPKKSFNCQARSAAFFVSLSRQNLLNEVLFSKESYIEFAKTQIDKQAQRSVLKKEIRQKSLFDL